MLFSERKQATTTITYRHYANVHGHTRAKFAGNNDPVLALLLYWFYSLFLRYVCVYSTNDINKIDAVVLPHVFGEYFRIN